VSTLLMAICHLQSKSRRQSSSCFRMATRPRDSWLPYHQE